MNNRFLVILIFFAIIIGGCAKNEPLNDTQFGEAPANPNAQILTDLITSLRTNGTTCGTDPMAPIPEIIWNDTLAQVAKAHCLDMNNNIGELSHTGSNQTLPRDRVQMAGYSLSDNTGIAIENLAKGYTTEQDVISAWSSSEGHCKNLMDSRVIEFGVGTSGAYWTLILASH